MSLGQKLINRTGALARKVKRLAPNFEDINEQTKVLSKATGSQKLILSADRQMDKSGIGLAVLAQKIEVAKLLAMYADLERVESGVQNVMTIADTGVAQVQMFTAVHDVTGSLNGTWFSISSVNALTKARKDWYVWLDDGTGIDPAPLGKTGIHVVYTSGDTASTISGLVASALAALTNDWSSATPSGANFTVTNAKPGAVPAAADGLLPTGFTFTAPSPAGVNSNLNNKYFLLNSGGDVHKYYVWNNVSSLGTDPAVPGRSPIEVDFAGGSSANTIASAQGAAIAAIASGLDFSTVVTTNNDAITNLNPAPAAPATDVNTGFTITESVSPNLQATINNIGTNIASSLQIAPKDLAEVLSGTLKGTFFTIASISNNVIQFVEDAPGYSPETSQSLRFEMRTTKPKVLPNSAK